MFCDKVPIKSIGCPILVEKNAVIACTDEQTNAAREYYNPDKKIVESDIDGEPEIHVGQDKLFPKGNCHKHGCKVCTQYDRCIQPEEIWSKKKQKKSKDNNPIISEEEKSLLQQLKRQQKRESFFDIGPIGGAS